MIMIVQALINFNKLTQMFSLAKSVYIIYSHMSVDHSVNILFSITATITASIIASLNISSNGSNALSSTFLLKVDTETMQTYILYIYLKKLFKRLIFICVKLSNILCKVRNRCRSGVYYLRNCGCFCLHLCFLSYN